MIKVIKLNKEELYVNPDLIEFIEATPDTALLLRGGKRIVIRDAVEDIIQQIIKYKKHIHSSITVHQKDGK